HAHRPLLIGSCPPWPRMRNGGNRICDRAAPSFRTLSVMVMERAPACDRDFFFSRRLCRIDARFARLPYTHPNVCGGEGHERLKAGTGKAVGQDLVAFA